jgi:hypothetical protein
VTAFTGSGLAPHETVLLANGKFQLIGELRVGDQLMGPDSEPRTVLATNPGHGKMYRVIPIKSEPFECNDVHILSLRCTSDNSYGKAGEVVNVPLNVWLAWPNGKKHVFKLWRAAVDFPTAKQRIDPYFLGVLLGDGSTQNAIAVHTMDPEIVDEVRRQAKVFGSYVVEQSAYTGKATSYHLRNRRGNGNRCALRLELHQLGLQVPCGEKFIPHAYKVADRPQRLAVLAGLLDTDGSLRLGTVFDFISKSKQLSKDVAFVARSLGFAAYVSECVKASQNGTVGTYWRVGISGDTHLIPTRLPRKRATERRQKKNPRVTGFRVEEIGDGGWCGIRLNGDRLYLLKDLTVTHSMAPRSGRGMVDKEEALINALRKAAPGLENVQRTKGKPAHKPPGV